MVVLDDDEPVDVVGRADDAGQLGRARGGHRRARRVLRARLEQHGDRATEERPGERLGHDPVLVEPHGHRLGAEHVEQVEERREARALDDDAIPESYELPERARDRVEGAVDDHDRLGLRRPRVGEHRGERGDHGLVLVAVGLGANRDPRERRAEGRQEQRVGRPSGEVEANRIVRRRHAAHARREPTGRALAHEAARAAARLDEAGPRQGLPRLAHRSGAHGELARELAHGRESGALRQFTRVDEAREHSGDGSRRRLGELGERDQRRDVDANAGQLSTCHLSTCHMNT
jgi:hypothetical protein